ncbi:MAG TPA: chloride channel protein [Phycisphaerae bacterium]|nr:chloride channel protein [Phycisphaerales bacterium]HPF38735.1 chloride channel protein [Phycisphaerae bacterium]HRW52889.1 chloride channel protein [Phycisphaerae bacterium]
MDRTESGGALRGLGEERKRDSGVRLGARQLWTWAIIIGLGGGVLALGYYGLMRTMLDWVWTGGAGIDPAHLAETPTFHPIILVITTIGGLLVGLVLHLLGTPGEIAAVVNNIHMEHGRIDTRQTPSMVAASLVSIIAGGSAGPEAPLVQIIGSFGSWVGDRLRLSGDFVRTFTFCGMAAALGAFFGAPLGGALFALEIPHRRGLEYYEALMPSIISAVVAFFVFRSVVGYDGPLYHLAVVPHLSVWTIAIGLAAGLGGGLVGILFVAVFTRIERLLHPLVHRKILLATLGGLVIGLIAQVMPATLFWGEYQIDGLLSSGEALCSGVGLWGAVGLLLLLAMLKMIAVGATLHSGFRGGFIFPLFLIGGAVGLAASLAASAVFPQVPAPVIILCMMAATNVAVTKTPVATTVILTSLSGTAFMPALAAACLASFLLTTRVTLIPTQRSRSRHPAMEAIGVVQ